MNVWVALVLVSVGVISTSGQQIECEKQTFESDSFVCVCTADHCDYPGSMPPPSSAGSASIVTSSRDEFRFMREEVDFSGDLTADANIIHLNTAYEYQEILGFGGAFTDSTGINIADLSKEAQDHVINSYFGEKGIEYTLCRIPIAGSDFSTRPYSYDDVDGDVALEHFALAEEDFNYKLPYINQANDVSVRNIKYFGSPWAPPAWMKENGMHNGTGGLLKEMWQPYAEYFVKFINSYEENGVPIWGITTQNEPLTGYEDWPWNTCLWTPEDTRDWVAQNLGPTLEANDLRRVQVMVLDHNRDALPWYPVPILENPAANKYVDGIAVHWYADEWTGPEVLSETAALFPDKFMLYTEACAGWSAQPGNRVSLGDWSRGELYADNIIDDIVNFQAGWVDWNMVLDMEGMPNWANNYVDAPIIVNKEKDEFYKQPTFYVMGHFSKFMLPGGHRVYTSVTGNENIKVAASHNPDGVYVFVILNKDENAQQISMETATNEYLNFEMPAKSIQTIMYKV